MTHAGEGWMEGGRESRQSTRPSETSRTQTKVRAQGLLPTASTVSAAAVRVLVPAHVHRLVRVPRPPERSVAGPDRRRAASAAAGQRLPENLSLSLFLSRVSRLSLAHFPALSFLAPVPPFPPPCSDQRLHIRVLCTTRCKGLG